MVGAIARGAQAINFKVLKAVQRKGYHRESSRIELKRMTDRTFGEETDTNDWQGDDATSWVPHPRTGIYYPKGQERIMEDIPVGATKYMADINRFSCSSDVQDDFSNNN